jgi:AhpD family alkylhydroperoxidase
MIKSLLHRHVRKFADAFDYDAGYVHEIIDTSTPIALKFTLFQMLAAPTKDVPADVLYPACVAAAVSEDCGPCAQLVVKMALKAGVSPRTITALLRGDLEVAGRDAELGFRYGIAVAQNTADAVSLSEEVERRFGKRALVTLSFAVAFGRVYPTVKRGLGHGAACTKIAVGKETVILKQAA